MTDLPIYTVNYVQRSQISGAGYGVFAGKDFQEGETVETCLFIEVELTPEFPTTLKNYAFGSHLNPSDRVLLMLGHGSLFNHSDTPNLSYCPTQNERQIVFRATRPIVRHSELCISYGSGWFRALPRK